MNGKCLRLIGMCVAFASAVALADWDPVYEQGLIVNQIAENPQLPTGTWDVMVDFAKTMNVPMLADDWVASGTRDVEDVHLWTSWRGDVEGTVTQIRLGILANANGLPGDEVWYGYFNEGTFSVRAPTTGPTSGWYDPFPDHDVTELNNHVNIYQINIPDLLLGVTGDGQPNSGPPVTDYFEQIDGATYWLSVIIDVAPSGPNESPQLGWHTTASGSGSGAVWLPTGSTQWVPLDVNGTLLDGAVDMAFVVTPEPGGLGLLLLGSASLALGRRRRNERAGR